ncbi:ribonuclease p protein subunit p29 [Phtheirospermum japonicum]|uniref:Ribonuclease P protein subunit p29 n=1 Tax=Phtheirospermum japonicum TaxID=374723 RepID=A0A830B7S8_9LAMI|nr:ribonuclease p protein subunit p29 [Phtheirospermum japonicum]
MEDQKRRTLEALERRFAQAKTEVENKQHKTKKRLTEDKQKVASNIEFSSAHSTSKKPRQDASSRKGNFSFLSHHTSKQDAEVNEPAYFKLSHPLLQHGDAAQKYIQGSKNLKIENTILLDNFVQKSGISGGGRNRALQNGSKRSKKHMSLKQHKISGSFDLPKEFHNFETFKPTHDKWKGYIQQLLKIVGDAFISYYARDVKSLNALTGKISLAKCFLNADLHGAIILVAQCKIVSYVGTLGIMVRETKETFGIITQDNKFRVVPKKGSVFVLQADCWKVTLHGDRLASRNLIP